MTSFHFFRNAAIEAVRAEELGAGASFPSGSFESEVLESLVRYATLYGKLGIVGPIQVMLSLINYKGVKFGVPSALDWGGGSNHSFDREVILLLPSTIESANRDNIARAIRPTLDNLWNAVGYAKDLYFDDQGIWNSQKFRV
jgi:hypothetical protein